ncbi:hypothetical protein R3P38DRAFT_620338 [Favolaschia claudopus]|uniref:Uncharacterized protein n=1 Tax=Favolaschia claudopus TaxID=2862362 RepID=A0AAW0C9K1_9AGAR
MTPAKGERCGVTPAPRSIDEARLLRPWDSSILDGSKKRDLHLVVWELARQRVMFTGSISRGRMQRARRVRVDGRMWKRSVEVSSVRLSPSAWMEELRSSDRILESTTTQFLKGCACSESSSFSVFFVYWNTMPLRLSSRKCHPERMSITYQGLLVLLQYFHNVETCGAGPGWDFDDRDRNCHCATNVQTDLIQSVCFLAGIRD